MARTPFLAGCVLVPGITLGELHALTELLYLFTSTSDGQSFVSLVYLTTTSDGSALVSLDLSLGLASGANCYVGCSSRSCLTSLPYMVPKPNCDAGAIMTAQLSLR